MPIVFLHYTTQEGKKVYCTGINNNAKKATTADTNINIQIFLDQKVAMKNTESLITEMDMNKFSLSLTHTHTHPFLCTS